MNVQFIAGKFIAWDNNGAPAVGYKIWPYLSPDTTTPADSYSDFECTSLNTWPVVLNTRGEAFIYVKIGTDFYLTLPTATDISASIWESRKVGFQQNKYITGTVTPVTLNNNYIVTSSPAVSALSASLTLVFYPDVNNTNTIVSTVFTGTGVNDLVASGPYTGTVAGKVFTFVIDSLATPDTFKWTDDGGTTWTTLVPITGSPQIIKENVTVQFSTTTGHTLTDTWAVTVDTPVRVDLDSLGNFPVYKNKGGAVVELDGNDMVAGYPAQLILNESLNAWQLMNPATPTFSTPTITAIRYRHRIVNADHTLVWGDQGYELAFYINSAQTLTLLSPPEFASRFFYVFNAGPGTLTINAGTYDIYGAAGSGAHSIEIGPGACYQLQADGVDWNILTTTGGYRLIETHNLVAAGTTTFTDLNPGQRYEIVGEFDVSTDSVPILIRFNADSGSNYLYCIVHNGNTTSNTSATLFSALYAVHSSTNSNVFMKFQFWANPNNLHNVNLLGESSYQIFSGGANNPISATCSGYYTGAANLTSVTVLGSGGTMTGKLQLWAVG